MPNPRRDRALRIGYTFGATDTVPGHDWGDTGDATEVFATPAKFGRVHGAVIYNVTETFVGTTTGGQILVGDGTDANAYFESLHTLLQGASPAVNGSVWLPDNISASIEIPSSQTTVTVTGVDCVGGTITGIAECTVLIDWYETTGYAGSSVGTA